MLFPHLTFVVEVIGACLLLVMIIYAVQLNRRLALLKADKAQLQKLIASFDESTIRAEASVTKLRNGAMEANESLQANMMQAKQLCDDLAFMIDRAGGVADRLENSIGAGRTETRSRSAAGIAGLRPNGSVSGNDVREKSRSKAALKRALEGIR